MLATATHMFQNIDCIRKKINGVSLSKKEIICYSTQTQQKLSLFITGQCICVNYIQDRRVCGDTELKRKKKETVGSSNIGHKTGFVQQLLLPLLDDQCGWMISVAGSCVLLPLKKKNLTGHQPLSNVVLNGCHWATSASIGVLELLILLLPLIM